MALKDTVGYDVEDFVDRKSAEEFLCAICLQVARDAYRTHCDCKAFFCKSCIEELRRASSRDRFTCPTCRAKLVGNNPYSQDDNLVMKINELAVFCSKKCDWTGELSKVEDHALECPKEVVKCSNGCPVEKERRFMLSTHLEDECVLRQVTCPHCKTTVVYQSRDRHLRLECPKIFFPCPNRGCKVKKLRRKRIDCHLTRCEYRMVACPNECGKTLQYLKLPNHVDNNCLKRVITCQFCCIEGKTRYINGVHFAEECQHVPVLCPNDGCAESIKRGLMQNHLAVCPKQLVRCKYEFCEKIMKLDEECAHYGSQMEEHLTGIYMKMKRNENNHIAHINKLKHEYYKQEAYTKEMKQQIVTLKMKLKTVEKENILLWQAVNDGNRKCANNFRSLGMSKEDILKQITDECHNHSDSCDKLLEEKFSRQLQEVQSSTSTKIVKLNAQIDNIENDHRRRLPLLIQCENCVYYYDLTKVEIREPTEQPSECATYCCCCFIIYIVIVFLCLLMPAEHSRQ